MFNMYEIKIGHVLKRILKEQRRTLKETSKETGIPYSTLHTWYENRQPKDIIKAQKLADYLGVALHTLLFDRWDNHEKKSNIQWDEILNNEDVLKGIFEVVIKKYK